MYNKVVSIVTAIKQVSLCCNVLVQNATVSTLASRAKLSNMISSCQGCIVQVQAGTMSSLFARKDALGQIYMAGSSIDWL